MVFSIEVNTGTFTRKWGDKDIQGLQVTVSWGLNLLIMVHWIDMYRLLS